MSKSIIPFIVVALLASMILSPVEAVSAQVISLPAEINKGFNPLSIAPGGIAQLSVTVYNPNPFPLTNASWTDNLAGVQPGLVIADPVGMTNSCGGSVAANPGSTTLSLSGGTVPAQTGSTPGRCTVTVNVTSNAAGENLINTIPARVLSATGGGTAITNTSPASATLNVTGTPPPTATPPPPTLPPVALSKRFSPSTIGVGGTSQLTIVITNNQTTASLTGVTVTDTLPANVLLADPVSPTLTGCGASASLTAASGGRSVTLNNGTIAPSSTCTIRVNVTSTVQGTYLNRIPANSLRTNENLSNPRDATDRLTVQAIGITKAFSPGTISAGGTATLTITLQNPTGSPYTGASFMDDLPAPLTVASGAPVSNTCGGTVSTTPANMIRLTGGTIPAGSPTAPGTCTISVQVTVPVDATSARLTNTIPANRLTTDQGVSNPRPATDRITLRGIDVTASKSFAPASIAPGENSRLRIDYIAPADTNLTNFSLRDDLPQGVTISNSTPPAMSGCGASAILTANTREATILLTNGTILAGQRCRITVYVTGSVAGTYTNNIPPGNISNTESRLPPNALTADLTVTTITPGPGRVGIALVKGFVPREVFGGAASTMSVELINSGDVPVTGITFTDNMPEHMILANPVNFNGGACGGTLSGLPGESSFTFSGGSLPAFGRCTLTLSATMTVNGNLTNTIPAGAVVTDLEGVTNPDPAEASLTNLPGASISKYFSPNPITPDSYSMLTITIQNTGNIPLTGLGFSDSLPEGLTIAGGDAPAAANDCGGSTTAVPGTQLIELNDGALAGNAACTFVVPITGSNPGAYQNIIPPGGLRTAPNLNVTNSVPATDTLVIQDGVAGGGGGGGRGRGNVRRPPTPVPAPLGAFLIPVTGFAPGRMTELDAASRSAYAGTSLTLEIPVLKIQAPIVGVESRQGKWDVAWLQNQVGWLNGTAYPTWKGNSVLTAHVANADGKPGVFANLKALGVGEYVFVYSGGYRYTYKVVSNAFVQPNDSSVMKHEEKPYLTLITCDTYDEKTGTYLRRVAVRAELVDVSSIK
jgi:LPXTG-site transpeptidase (sortase) family protein